MPLGSPNWSEFTQLNWWTALTMRYRLCFSGQGTALTTSQITFSVGSKQQTLVAYRCLILVLGWFVVASGSFLWEIIVALSLSLPLGPNFGKCCPAIPCLWMLTLRNVALPANASWPLLWKKMWHCLSWLAIWLIDSSLKSIINQWQQRLFFSSVAFVACCEWGTTDGEIKDPCVERVSL